MLKYAVMFTILQLWTLLSAVIEAFGFLAMCCHIHQPRQYVHLSGGMFLTYEEEQHAFLWSWNHMLSHRYKNSTWVSLFSYALLYYSLLQE